MKNKIECSHNLSGVCVIKIDGVAIMHHVQHSPSGMSMGYLGSGPADAALAILWHIVGEERARKHYQMFKNMFVSKWGRDSHEGDLDIESVVAWMETGEENSMDAPPMKLTDFLALRESREVKKDIQAKTDDGAEEESKESKESKESEESDDEYDNRLMNEKEQAELEDEDDEDEKEGNDQ